MTTDERKLYDRLSKVQSTLMKLITLVETAKLTLLKGDDT